MKHGVGANWFAVKFPLMLLGLLGWNEACPEQAAPPPDYCPAAATLVPDFNSGQLVLASLNCHESGFDDQALQLLLASEARRMLDVMYLPPDSPDAVTLTDEGNQARSRMEAASSRLLAMDRRRIESAFLSLMEMEPSLHPSYDPGWEHQAMPDEAAYQSEFEFIVATFFAAMIPQIQLKADPLAASLQEQLESLRVGNEPLTEAHREDAIALFQKLDDRLEALTVERADFIVPELVARRIRSFGLYDTTGEVEIVDAADTADGSALRANLEHARETSVVPAKLGVSFGYEFELGGIIPGTVHLLKMRAIHPPFRNVEGELQTMSTAPFDAFASGTRYSNHITYAFNSDYHLVAGKWTLQVLYGDEVIISRDFHVVEPAVDG